MTRDVVDMVEGPPGDMLDEVGVQGFGGIRTMVGHRMRLTWGSIS